MMIHWTLTSVSFSESRKTGSDTLIEKSSAARKSAAAPAAAARMRSLRSIPAIAVLDRGCPIVEI